LAYLGVSTASYTVFGYFVNLVTIFGLLTWISILICHVHFVKARKAQGVPDSALAYVAPFGIIGSYIAIGFCCLIAFFKAFNVFFGNFDYSTFITSYLGIPLYIIMIVGYKFIMKSKHASPETADIFSGKQRIDDEEAEFLEQEKIRNHGKVETKWGKVYRYTIGNLF
jgi:amino acid transporter